MKTKKHIKYYIGIITIMFLLSAVAPIKAYADNGNIIVHVTRTGSKYHNGSCSYLHSSDIRTTLYDAVITYKLSPCSRCDPPRLSDTQIREYKRAIEEEQQKELEEFSKPFVIIGYIVTALIVIPMICNIGYIIYESITSICTKQRKKKLENMLYSHYFSMYAFYHPLDFVQVPEGSFLKYGLPATKGKRKYGDYTVYITPRGECFHQNPQCSKKLETSNYVYAYNRRPCKRCVKDKIPEIQWYLDIAKITKIKKEYNIP